MEKFTKIVCTLGPATDTVAKIRSLYENGMNVARLNFSHGSYEYFTNLIKNIREVSENIAILLDTKGPEIRTGPIENDEVYLEDKQKLILTSEQVEGNNEKITLNYSSIGKVHVGNRIFIDDGLIEARVNEILSDTQIEVEILNGGLLGSRKTVTIRGHDVEIPFLSQKDIEDIKYGIENDLDFIAASFVRKPEDLDQIQKLIDDANSQIRIISKIEHGDAVKHIDEIIPKSDGIMIARGDLGVEMPLEEVPKAQRDIILKCNYLGKPVIVATQMLESMKSNPRPTRAEVSDVAQAILQGTDAIMLSGETAAGKYPVKTVKTMAKIAQKYDREVVSRIEYPQFIKNNRKIPGRMISSYITRVAFRTANALSAKAILVPTESGFTARKVSRFKSQSAVFAITHKPIVARQLQLSWGVFPRVDPAYFDSKEELVNDLIQDCVQENLVYEEDIVVIIYGRILGEQGHTNTMEVYKVQDILERIG